MKRTIFSWILVTFVAFVITPDAYARDAGVPESKLAAGDGGTGIEGIWQGVIEAGSVELRIVFHLSAEEDGSLTAAMDSPDQGVEGIPVAAVTFEGDSLRIDVAVAAGVFEGLFDSGEQMIRGEWKQAGMTFPLELVRITEVEKLSRPQEPEEPYPYASEEVSYANEGAGVTIAGTITYPREGGPFPAVLLISGSGPQDKNETVMGHKPFLVLSDYLTRRGIAVLRVDDRGVGGSTGDFSTSTSKDFADDVLAGIDFLSGRPEVDGGRIGLAGHSEGGIIAPMAAVWSEDVAFIVLMAGTGMNGSEILLVQNELILQANGVEEGLMQRYIGMLRLEHGILAEESDDEAARERLDGLVAEYEANFSAEEMEKLGINAEALGERANVYLSPWFRFFMRYDPAPMLERVECPVLAIGGEKDLQVEPNGNLAAIESALAAGGNPEYKVLELPGLNHLFQSCETGSPNEYATIEETISPSALEVIGDWILER